MRRLGQRRAELVAQHAGFDLFERAFGDLAELERPEGEPDQPVDLEPQMFEHALDLAVLALAQAHGEPAIGALRAVERRLDPGVIDAIDRDALAQPVERGLVGLALGAHAIAPQPAGRRQFEHAREAAVVGQQQQPLGVDVEPADADEARRVRPMLAQIIEDGLPPLGVAARW